MRTFGRHGRHEGFDGVERSKHESDVNDEASTIDPEVEAALESVAGNETLNDQSVRRPIRAGQLIDDSKALERLERKAQSRCDKPPTGLGGLDDRGAAQNDVFSQDVGQPDRRSALDGPPRVVDGAHMLWQALEF